jgi:hypothetical protein
VLSVFEECLFCIVSLNVLSINVLVNPEMKSTCRKLLRGLLANRKKIKFFSEISDALNKLVPFPNRTGPTDDINK